MRWINLEIINQITDYKVVLPTGLTFILYSITPNTESFQAIFAIMGSILTLITILNKAPDVYEKYKKIIQKRKNNKK